MPWLMPWLQQRIFNNSMEDWISALLVVVLSALLLQIAKKVLSRSLMAVGRKLPGNMGPILSETVACTKFTFILIISVYAGSRIVDLPDKLTAFLRYLAVIAGGFQAGIWGSCLASRMIKQYVDSTKNEELSSAQTVISLSVRVLIWSAVLLLVLDNLGVTVTTLIAGLGVGGIAVAMASQHVLADLFASMSILLDKPFRLGEFIVVGELLGSVENIGLKTTRLRSLSGEELIFSNTDLLSSRIRNYKTMQQRRVVFTIGVEYSTPYEKLNRIPGIIRGIIDSIDHVRFDRSHFSSFGDFALTFETVYYVLNPDYNVYMDIQQEINFRIFKKFEEEQIIFAFPTRTIHLKHENGLEGRLPDKRADDKKAG